MTRGPTGDLAFSTRNVYTACNPAISFWRATELGSFGLRVMHSPLHDVECTIPVLPVSNLRRAVQFYTETLGFLLDWDSETVCSVSRDNCHIMLSQDAEANGRSCVWIGLESDSLFHEFKQRGVTVLREPRNYPWAYEMKFADMDGNILWLGTECRTDLPLANETPA